MSPVRKNILPHHTKHILKSLVWLALLWTLPVPALQAGKASLPVTPIARVHDLPFAQARERLPVHLVGTVTYYDSSEHTLFISDKTGSIYVATSGPLALRQGDLVDVEGFTAPSFRTTVSKGATIRVLGNASANVLKVPGLRTYNEIMTSKWDCGYVTVRGRVRSALVENHDLGRYLEIELLMPGGLVQSYIQDFGQLNPKDLIDADVEVAGVVGGEFNGQWQLMRAILYTANAADLKILRKPALPPEALPTTAISHVMETQTIIDQTPRVRIRGAVTAYRPGRFLVIQSEGRGLFATTRQAGPIALGSVVDLVGFAEEGEYGPGLGQAEVLQVISAKPIPPAPVTYAQAISGAYSDELVTVQGSVLSQIRADQSETLTLMVEGHPVTVVLPRTGQFKPLIHLPLGTRVSVVGICRVTATGIWTTPGTTAMMFRIDTRTPADLHVLSWPSWWNLTHVLFVFGVFGALSLLIALWAMILRSKVACQTARIATTMRIEQERSRLLEAINSERQLEDLLNDICNTFANLGNDIAFGCTLSPSGDQNALFSFTGSKAPELVLEMALMDLAGQRMGVFCVSRTKALPLTEHDLEISQTAAGLARLAVNQRKLYEELNYTSSHDQLTGLPNRRSADLALESALQHAGTGRQVGVLYIDVDRFKQVNDQYGHKVGDLYLQQISLRLSGATAPSDRLARIGGDEFLVIATSISGTPELEAYRGRLEACFARDFLLDGIAIQGSSSIGIAMSPAHGQLPEALKRHADIDMYAAKYRRRSTDGEDGMLATRPEIFTPKDLREALQEERFTLYYQPQFSSGGQLKGLEALLRLQDPILGLVSPDAFIGVAERDPLIVSLGHWVLRKALSDCVEWGLPEMPETRIIVNVSARELDNPAFAGKVLQALTQYGVPPNRLELEITERVAMQDLALAQNHLRTLHARGVHIAIDDFGTEYSCLSALHKLSVDTLKIDRSFLLARSDAPEVIHTIEAIVSLAHTFQKRIVVEGVETAEEVGILSRLGEVDLQGFFFSKPQPAHLVRSHLESWRSQFALHR